MTPDASIRALFSYRLCGVRLCSDVPLPELSGNICPGGDNESALHIEWSGPASRHSLPLRWFLNWHLPSGELWLSAAKVESGYLLRFYGLADFTIDHSGRTIRCVPATGVPEDTLRHLLLDHVVPLVLTLHGRHTFHATAVHTAQGVCAFLGPTGVGKSTLAASFLSAGYSVLSDDCLAIEESSARFLAIPAYPGLRLYEDALEAMDGSRHMTRPVAHYTSKRRPIMPGHAPEFRAEPQPLAGIYVLLRPEEPNGQVPPAPAVEPLTRREAFMAVLTCAYRFDVSNQSFLVRQFDFLDRLASAVPIRRLRLPNNLAALSQVRRAVLADLEAAERQP